MHILRSEPGEPTLSFLSQFCTELDFAHLPNLSSHSLSRHPGRVDDADMCVSTRSMPLSVALSVCDLYAHTSNPFPVPHLCLGSAGGHLALE